jgi:DUF438 domain-containing protein
VAAPRIALLQQGNLGTMQQHQARPVHPMRLLDQDNKKIFIYLFILFILYKTCKKFKKKLIFLANGQESCFARAVLLPAI